MGSWQFHNYSDCSVRNKIYKISKIVHSPPQVCPNYSAFAEKNPVWEASEIGMNCGLYVKIRKRALKWASVAIKYEFTSPNRILSCIFPHSPYCTARLSCNLPILFHYLASDSIAVMLHENSILSFLIRQYKNKKFEHVATTFHVCSLGWQFFLTMGYFILASYCL